MKITVGGIVAGVVFGALTSLANVLSSPYGEIGARVAGTDLAKASKVLSLLLDAGWSWAALAVAVGWVAGSRVRGALGGLLALVAATVSYYVTDLYLWDAGTDMMAWLVVGVPLGLILGTVGALARQPGITGLIAALIVPTGAAAQMVVLPPGEYLTTSLPETVTEAIVWTGAVFGAVWALYRFWRERRVGTA
ncbi:DUF6518 family protein (plasmid) [Streptomyces canus]|uniref:DUF6518 family protein n=1 Tax=Streptomyces canus TaxID=58343 RepID=UPI002F914A4A|nr:DUF6518 family protein [Streptomyces canus]WSW40739.1 DUF6518 family protein [Streptomyces canus]WSW41315.1 DUF6518 family protein [Streptomyces canus]